MPTVQRSINAHFEKLESSKSDELQQLHSLILSINPACKLWFDNGINEVGKVVTNPTIGYGSLVLKYANGTSRDFFQIGICATTSGISIYLIGMQDKNAIKDLFGTALGKATITGYCVKYKRLSDLHIETLNKLIAFGFSTR